MKATKAEKAAMLKAFADAEDRAMAKIKARMYELAKDKKLAKRMEKEICQTLPTSKALRKSAR